MANDQLPGTMLLYTREQHVQKYLRDYRLVDPAAETGPGTQPYNDASALADQLVVVGHNAQVIANGTTDANSAGEWLEARGEAIGVEWGEATGASGFVQVRTSSGGGFIDEDVEIRHKASRLRFKCAVADTYVDGDIVPVIGIDTGPETNLDPGEAMEWPNPPVGIYPTAEVFEASDGSGLTGGRAKQTEEEYREDLRQQRANPPASGNDAEYVKAVKKMPGIGIQQVFTVPAIRGPGTTGIMFTLRPARPGATRIPNAAQLALVESNLHMQFPADDGIFMCELLEQEVTVVLRVRWSGSAAGFVDVVPWPTYVTPTVRVKSSPTPTATTFTLYTTASSPPNPAIGQTIAFFNQPTGRFVRKRILSVSTSLVSGETRWAIVCDTTNNASDTSYTPAAEQLASPWSDSLNTVGPSVITHFDGLGPGEQVSTFYDAGRRQKRQPESPGEWPSQVTNRLVAPIFSLSAVADVVLSEPTVPYSTTVGTPGVESYLLTLGDLAILKQ
jgi:hypothetical protein